MIVVVHTLALGPQWCFLRGFRHTASLFFRSASPWTQESRGHPRHPIEAVRLYGTSRFRWGSHCFRRRRSFGLTLALVFLARKNDRNFQPSEIANISPGAEICNLTWLESADSVLAKQVPVQSSTVHVRSQNLATFIRRSDWSVPWLQSRDIMINVFIICHMSVTMVLTNQIDG